MRFLLPLLLLCLLPGTRVRAQDAVPEAARTAPTATAVPFPAGITLDGKLDEAVWLRSTPATDFWETFPADTSRAAEQTEVYFGYDDRNLYVGARCYVKGDDYVIPSLRRDYRAGGNDNLTIIFNPFKDQTNAIVFGMNPYGVTREALIYNGGESGGDFREEWDNKWRGESYRGEGFYSMEMVIPFTSLRFPDGATEWYFQSYRFDTQSNVRSTWHHIPQNQIIMSLAYMGTLKFEGGAPRAPGRNLTVIPYVSGSATRNYEEGTPTDFDGGIGGDAKIGIGSGLNLDLTVNPDFSQVEVDQQVINTTRFEVFFPERRQFFLENADLFGSFGFGNVNPFFSRRIGVTRDTSTGQALQNPIYYGARLSGKATDDLRVGLLNMQAQDNFEQGLPSYNYTVAALQQRVGSRSAISGIFVNKQNFGEFRDTSEVNQGHNRVAGLDYLLATKDNRWNGKVFLHRSLSERAGGDGYAHGLALAYRVRNWNLEYEHRYVDDDYRAEVGFVPRRDIFSTNVGGRYIRYPDNPNVIEKGPNWTGGFFSKPGSGITDYSFFAGYRWRYANTSSLNFFGGFENIFLINDFDPSRSDGEFAPLPGGLDYGAWRGGVEYASDRRKVFSYAANLRGGEFFNGRFGEFSGSIVYRYQPLGAIDLRFNYQYLDLPEPFARTPIFLIGPRIDLTFSKSLFLTTFLQYNDQIENINVNARLQWRFAPVSDFFLVYTDNYNSLDYSVKSRAIVAKMTYWLNI